ncbi:MAG: ABC transporter permease [Bacteroidetes bacterium]|nr:ABC transporter permease [Bacteroidota bacterium]
MKNKILKGLSQVYQFMLDELRIIFHDPGAILVFFIALIIYPLLYSLAYDNETVKENPVAFVDLDHSSFSRKLARMADATEQLKVSWYPGSLKEAQQLFFNGEIRGVILVPKGFEKNILRGTQATVTVYTDAGYFLLYKQVYAGSVYSLTAFNTGIKATRLLNDGITLNHLWEVPEPLKLNTHTLYNPAGGYGSFVMTGIILVILQQTLLIGIGLLGGTTRERNRYNHQKGPKEITGGSISAVLGKSMAYLLIYLVNSVFALMWVYQWFHFPDKSGFLSTLILLVPYLLSVSFLGLAISVLFRERVHSLLFMVFLSPIVLFLSGLSWPASSLPPLLYSLAHLYPSTIMVPAYIRMRMMGVSVGAVSIELGWLLIQMSAYFVLACVSYHYAHKRFDRKIGNLAEIELPVDPT